jgi:hypothetical protein
MILYLSFPTGNEDADIAVQWCDADGKHVYDYPNAKVRNEGGGWQTFWDEVPAGAVSLRFVDNGADMFPQTVYVYGLNGAERPPAAVNS